MYDLGRTLGATLIPASIFIFGIRLLMKSVNISKVYLYAGILLMLLINWFSNTLYMMQLLGTSILFVLVVAVFRQLNTRGRTVDTNKEEIPIKRITYIDRKKLLLVYCIGIILLGMIVPWNVTITEEERTLVQQYNPLSQPKYHSRTIETQKSYYDFIWNTPQGRNIKSQVDLSRVAIQISVLSILAVVAYSQIKK
jgi:hypothetical protein